MPPHDGLGTDDRENIQDRREPSNWIKNQRSLFVSRTRPCILRRKTIN
jgi:hypothetical protein